MSMTWNNGDRVLALGIDDIVAGPGATPLFAIIVLMMLAVRLFEPKLMWRTAGVPA